MQAVSVTALGKRYKNGKHTIDAVRDLSFEVTKGELFGIIGPDGAGKTSLFRMLTTLLVPDEGQATVDGNDIVKDYRHIRRSVGYMPGHFSLYQDLTVQENLDFFATIFHTTVQENYALIKDIYEQIAPFKDRRAGKLSGGMKQKLALCCALIHRPSVLFLDEPTTGVDAVSRKEFWDMLRQLKQEGITMLVSTPYMDEAALCDRIALMQEGRLLSVGTPDEIIAAFEHTLLAVQGEGMYRLLQDLQQCDLVLEAYSFGEYHHVVMKERHDAPALTDYLRIHGHPGAIVRPAVPTIEDRFMQLMKK